ncbi:MAG: copper amine oxidase N-terminal domain-containing protein [Eubacteriales bacterium]|nr:copper amine oxidase N-terminal domain-containing protein [Eubacteriales bacterium]
MNKTTKKLLGLTTAAALCLSQISAFAAPSTDKVILNGNEIIDITLENISDRNLMPLRAISELMGASVYWFDDDKSIQIVSGDRMIRYAIGNDHFTPYGLSDGTFKEFETLPLPNNVAPQIIGDKTYIPLRAAVAALLINTPDEINSETLSADIPDKFTYNDGNINITYNTPTDYAKIADVKSDEKYLSETYRIKGRLEWDNDKWKVSDGEDSYISFKNPSEGVLDEQLRINGKVYDANGLTVVMTGFAYRDEGQSESYLKLSRATASLRPVTADLSIDGDKDKFSYSVESITNGDKSVSSEKLPVGATVDIKANEGTDTDKFKVYYNGNALDFENGTAKITVAEGENKLEIKEESVNVELPECFEPVTDLINLKVGDKIEFKVKDGYIVNTTDGTKLSVKVNDTATDAEVVQDFITETKPTGKKDDNGNEITEEIKTPNGQHYEIPVTSENMKIAADWIKVDEDSKVAANVIAYVNNHVRFTYPNDISTISLNGKADSLKKDGMYIISVDAVASGTTVSITAPTAAPEKADEQTADNTETKVEDNTEVKTDTPAATPEK